jgi:hypothetical protein
MILRYSRLHRCVQYESVSLTKPLKHLLTRLVLSLCCGTFDNSYRSINSIQCSCFASAFRHSKDSIVCPRFSMFSTISGNLLLARSKPRSSNYIGFWYSFGTAEFENRRGEPLTETENLRHCLKYLSIEFHARCVQLQAHH